MTGVSGGKLELPGVAVVAGGSGALGPGVCESPAREGWPVAVLYHRRASAAAGVLGAIQSFGVEASARQV